MFFFGSADDPSKSISATDADVVTTKAAIAAATDGDGRLQDESVDRDSNAVSFKQSDVAASDSLLADDDDDRVVFNADILCSEHGEIQTYCIVIGLLHCCIYDNHILPSQFWHHLCTL